MTRSPFVSWTRRQLGPAAAGLAVVLASLVHFGPIDAKKKHSKHKKKRCNKLGESCVDGGRRCCHDRTCGGDPALGTFCCKQGGAPCSKNGDCCNRQCFQGACAPN